MREHLRTILTCLVAVALLAWIVPFSSLAGPQTSTQPYAKLVTAKASLTNLSGAACSLASVSGTPEEDSWQITYAAHAGSAVVATATSRLFNRSFVEIIAETDTSTTLISGLTLIWSDTVAVTDIDVVSVYREVPLKAQSDSALWVATLDTVVTVADTVTVTTTAQDLRDNPDYTNSYVGDAVDPDSTGEAGFNYVYAGSLSVADTLRVPTTGNRIHLDGLAWSWVVEYGDDLQDSLHFAVHQGVSMTDSVFWWSGTPDELMKANHKVHPFQITLKPDSALVVRIWNTKRGNDAALLRIYLPGYERAD